MGGADRRGLVTNPHETPFKTRPFLFPEMSLGSQDGANTGQTDQLYYVPVSAQYPSSTSTYDSTYPTSNLGTQGPVSYTLLPGLRVSVHLTTEYRHTCSNSNKLR